MRRVGRGRRRRGVCYCMALPMLKNVKSEMAFCASVVWLKRHGAKKYEFSRVVGVALVRNFGLCEDENEIASGNSAYGA